MLLNSNQLWQGIVDYMNSAAQLEAWRTGAYSTPRALRVERGCADIPEPSSLSPIIIVDLLGIDEPDEGQTDRWTHGNLIYHFHIKAFLEAKSRELVEIKALDLNDSLFELSREESGAGFYFGMAGLGVVGSRVQRSSWSRTTGRVQTAWQTAWSRFLDVAVSV